MAGRELLEHSVVQCPQWERTALPEEGAAPYDEEDVTNQRPEATHAWRMPPPWPARHPADEPCLASS